jgi:hypothetical protein
MKTKEEILKEGYPEDWATQCSKCGSYYCHAYKDQIFCFDCQNINYNILNCNICKSSKDILIINSKSVCSNCYNEKPLPPDFIQKNNNMIITVNDGRKNQHGEDKIIFVNGEQITFERLFNLIKPLLNFNIVGFSGTEKYLALIKKLKELNKIEEEPHKLFELIKLFLENEERIYPREKGFEGDQQILSAIERIREGFSPEEVARIYNEKNTRTAKKEIYFKKIRGDNLIYDNKRLE